MANQSGEPQTLEEWKAYANHVLDAATQAEMQAAAYRDVALELREYMIGDSVIDSMFKKAGLPGLYPHEVRRG